MSQSGTVIADTDTFRDDGPNTPLGTRMKTQYEMRARAWLPRRTYSIIRIDGKAFHNYTRGLQRPYDQQLMDDLCETAKYLCEQIDGAVLAYAQSDEISLLLTDFANIRTQAWFDGQVQKIVSVSASMAAAFFNRLRPGGPLAVFDSRVFTIPDPAEVANYFIWRQLDATRNSISMAAQSQFSHTQLHRVSCDQMQEMLFTQKAINWNDYPDRFKRGTLVFYEKVPIIERYNTPVGTDQYHLGVSDRHVWTVDAAPIFTQDPWLMRHIPLIP